MSRLLYTLFYYSLTPLLFLRLLLKHRKSRAYKEQRQDLRLAERFGFFSAPDFSTRPVWFHTVSVGEFIAALPLIQQLRQQYPRFPLVITCTTTTGSAQICKTFAAEIKAGTVFHVYLPYDLPGAMQRFMQQTRPFLGLIMETEIWPNLLHTAQHLSIPVWLLNARMSVRSARGYSRFPGLSKMALQQFAGIAAQDAMDAGRLKALGARDETLYITGSIKFDLKLNPQHQQAGAALRKQLQWQDNKVLIAASTHKGEDEILLRVYQQLKSQHNNLVMIIVPRHPERFQAVAQLLNSVPSLRVVKRSEMEHHVLQTPVDLLLGDSMGEMMLFYACADIVFMGGTLVATGGHNILEPAALQRAIVYGPHMFNFNAINDLFLHYDAARQVADEAALVNVLDSLLSDDKQAAAMAQRATKLMRRNAGALDKILSLLEPALK